MEIGQHISAQDMLSQDDGATSVASLSNITTIPITQAGKYVITCEVDRKMSARELRELQRLLEIWGKSLDDWWNSDSKFFVVLETNGMPKVRFERLEKPDEDDNEL